MEHRLMADLSWFPGQLMVDIERKAKQSREETVRDLRKEQIRGLS